MKIPLTPPPLKQREEAFKKKIAHQEKKPLGTPPVPMMPPRIVADPLKKVK